MTNTPDLESILEELHELRLLYKKIAEQHIPTEEPSPQDIKDLERREETVGEEEIWRALNRPTENKGPQPCSGSR
jgi:hypothetical protein